MKHSGKVKARAVGRPAGKRNPDYEATRAALLNAVLKHVRSPDGAHPSFRQLAGAAGVSVATLRHYFESRDAVIAALIEHVLKALLQHFHTVAAGPLPPSLRESMAWFLDFLRGAFAAGADRFHAFCLSEGLADPIVGPSYVTHLLEPTLQALEARLERHIARGDMRPANVRHAALALVSPILLARLHQSALGGARCRPLDEHALGTDLLETFLAAHEMPRVPRS